MYPPPYTTHDTDWQAWDPRKIDHTVVPDWYDHPGYLATQAKLINTELEEFKNNPKDVKVMFSAHGVPESYVEAGDPYKGQIEKCAELIMKEVNKNRGNKDIDWTLCFQSRVGPVKWLEPYTDDVLQVYCLCVCVCVCVCVYAYGVGDT